MLALLTALALAEAPASLPDPGRMAGLYEELCLKAFPDDAAVDALMAAKKATPLAPDQVKVTLRDDPGRGWAMQDNGHTILVFLELPPYHACSVRFPAGNDMDVSAYRSAADRYVRSNPRFAPEPAYDADVGDIHIHGTSEARQLPDGSTDTLMLIDQHITDPQRRARGETGVMRRFVHQIREKSI